MTSEEIEAKLAKLEADMKVLAEAFVFLGDTLSANQRSISFLLEQLKPKAPESPIVMVKQ